MSVDIRSDRRFDFAVERAEVWAAIARVDRYQEWWPWLRDFEGSAFRAGERWQCEVRPPLPYRLRFEVVLDEVVDCEHVRARVAGDIAGWAELTATDRGSRSEVRLVSELAPTNPMLRLIAQAARPVVTFGHDWVLDTGARQFRAVALGP